MEHDNDRKKKLSDLGIILEYDLYPLDCFSLKKSECPGSWINSAPYAYRMSRESEVNVQACTIAPHFQLRA